MLRTHSLLKVLGGPSPSRAHTGVAKLHMLTSGQSTACTRKDRHMKVNIQPQSTRNKSELKTTNGHTTTQSHARAVHGLHEERQTNESEHTTTNEHTTTQSHVRTIHCLHTRKDRQMKVNVQPHRVTSGQSTACAHNDRQIM